MNRSYMGVGEHVFNVGNKSASQQQLDRVSGVETHFADLKLRSVPRTNQVGTDEAPKQG